MSGNGKIQCPNCRQTLQILRSGLGQIHLKCGCGIENQGFNEVEAANMIEFEVDKIRKMAINLMITDVCI